MTNNYGPNDNRAAARVFLSNIAIVNFSGSDGCEARTIVELLEEMVRQRAEMVPPARLEPHVILTPIRRPIVRLVNPTLGFCQRLEFVVVWGALDAVEECDQRGGMVMLQRSRKQDVIIEWPEDNVETP